MMAAPRRPNKFRESHEVWVDVGYHSLARADRRSASVHLPTGIVASLGCVGLMIQKQTDGASIAVRHSVWWVHGRLQARLYVRDALGEKVKIAGEDEKKRA